MPTRRGFAASLAAGWLAAALLATPAAAADVTVFAAASLKNALDDVAAAWKADAGKEATISYAASSALAKQIEEGAPADVFISADLDWMDYLAERDLVQEGHRRRAARQPPRAGRAGRFRPPAIDDRPGLRPRRRCSATAASPWARSNSVPAGKYGKAALTTLGVWDSVAASVAQAENVRAALALVSTGEAPLGIVYADRRQRRAEGEDRRHLPRGQPPADRLSRRDHRRGEERRRRAPSWTSCAARRGAALFEEQGFTVSRPALGGLRTARRMEWLGLSPDEWTAVRLSIRVSTWATLVSLPFGIADRLAAGAPASFPARRSLNGLVHLPLILPPVVTGYLLLLTFGRRGPDRRLSRRALRHRLRLPLDRRGARLRHHGLPAAGPRDPAVDRGGRPAARGGGRDARRQPALGLPDRDAAARSCPASSPA